MFERRPTKDQKKQILNSKLALIVTKDYERILIGTEENIKKRLDGHLDVDVMYDETKPFGSLLLTMDTDPEGEWGTVIFHLKQAQESIHSSRHQKTQKLLFASLPGQPKLEFAPTHEARAQEILIKKYNSADPICQFVATRIWYGYWVYREGKSPDNCELFLNSMHNLIRPFSCYRGSADERIAVNADNRIFRHTQEMRSYDKEHIIYTPSDSSMQDCIIVDKSLIPLEKYYLSKFDKWKKYIIRCKVCGRLFMADTLKFKLCSDECKKQARLNNLVLRKQDKDTSNVDSICINASAHWYNRLDKIRKSSEWTEEDVQKYVIAKDQFLKEKRKKRRAHKMGKLSFVELRDWLLHQEVAAQEALEALMVTKR